MLAITSTNHHRLLLVISLEIKEIGIPRALQGRVVALGTWVFRPLPDPHVPEIGQLDQLYQTIPWRDLSII